MTRRLLCIFIPVLILAVLLGRFRNNREIENTGIQLLVPVNVHRLESDGFSSFVRLHYQTLIPAAEIEQSGGKIIVSRAPNGRIEYVSPFNPSEPLRAREHILQYTIAYSLNDRPVVRFGAEIFRLPPDFDVPAGRIAYAVLKINKDGRTVLTGLADHTGSFLIRN